MYLDVTTFTKFELNHVEYDQSNKHVAWHSGVIMAGIVGLSANRKELYRVYGH